MFADSPEAINYLRELFEATSGDPANQVSMYEVGAALGLDKAEAGKVAEDLIGNGLVEVKTLSGGIGITAQGIEAVQGGTGPADPSSEISLGSGPVLDDQGQSALEELLADLKTAISQISSDYAALEEMVLDIKTAEVQMLSPKPKTVILREVLRSLQAAMAAAGSTDLATRLKQIVES